MTKPKRRSRVPLRRQELRRPVPPVHDEVGALVHVRVRRPQRLGIAVAERVPRRSLPPMNGGLPTMNSASGQSGRRGFG